MTLESLIDSLHRQGGGFHTFPSGSVTVFTPQLGGWTRRDVRCRSGEAMSATLYRALTAVLEGEALD